MLLLLALVYFFIDFQAHAAPLTSLLAEVAQKTTVSSTFACVCPADQRSILNILWSSLATIFACSWVSVHPNIPGPDEAWWKVLLRRLELMFWAVVSPELLISWAFRQWLGARNLENLYKDKGWTKTHGYFIQMGGFVLFEGEDAKGVLSPGRFSRLLLAKKIEFPIITVEEIQDRSKGDGFSKTIALGQTLWFVVQCLARRAEHLDLTLVELLTLSLAVLNGVMYFLWWHKPLDVRCPVRVYLLDKLNEPDEAVDNLNGLVYSGSKPIFLELSSEISKRRRQITIVWQSLSIPGKILMLISWTMTIPALLALTFPILLPLAFIVLFLSLLIRWSSIFLTISFNTGDMKVPTFYSSEANVGKAIANILLISTSVTGAVFGGIHCAGWFFIFPSSEEAILWRVCSAVLTCIAILLPVLFFLVATASGAFQLPVIFAAFLAFIVYVLSRLLLLVEAFISLRQPTPGMLAVVKWTTFIPHIWSY